MFCINCGKEINDNQKFCRYCGTKNEIDNDLTSSNSEILNNTQSQQMNTVFNRDVLNNYLYNTRLLEISKNKLTNKKNPKPKPNKTKTKQNQRKETKNQT